VGGSEAVGKEKMDNTNNKLVEDFKGILEDNLVSIARYGTENQYLLVTEKLDFHVLEKVQSQVREWAKKIGKLPLFLTREELTDGLDVFPLEFLNIKLNHDILYGEHLFDSLEFKKQYIRRELEFEFRSKLINLRQGYIQVVDSKENLRTLLGKAIPTLMPICNGLLFLKDMAIPGPVTEVLDKIFDTYNINTEVLKDIHAKNLDNLTDIELKNYVNKLVVLLSTLGEILDEMRM